MHRQPHALLYCRSPHNSARALGAQEERCKRRAMEEGAATTATIFDDGRATAGLDRPAVAEVRRLLRSGGVDLLVVDSPQRLTHSIADLRALRQEVAQAGARLLFVSP